MGNLYWALRALVGMHSKLNIAHEYLQDSTIINILSLNEIAADFTAPPQTTDLDSLAALLGVVLYFVGGAAGMVGVGAATAATSRAAAQASRLGVLNAQRTRTQNNWFDGPEKTERLAKIDTAITNAQKIGDKTTATQKQLGVLGSSTYFMGGTFGIIGIGESHDPGTITGDDLETDLRNLFIQASTYLNETGLMAAGHAAADTDYALLPGQQDEALYFEDNAIANFYSNGKFLISESDATFRNSILDAFNSFRPRIVDMAMKKSIFHVLAETGYDSEQSCIDLGGFGARWIDNLCVNLWQKRSGTCPESQDRCEYFLMEETQHKALTDKYGFDIYTYYASQMDCGKNGAKFGEPDIETLPESGETPLCWYGVEAYKGAFERRGGADEPGDQTFAVVDW
ncbi:hypothetical protein LTR37_011504 [Vermiconidia calcicola]|uniref:Uncharacterized protein n=1 Tax=Vermiconidia calcicola TaxID=1690605 RepID=A0ACC3N3E6_9PEZI|nr:hypothetical protein LTR37_011504 [Vermiconidia calcicola]